MTPVARMALLLVLACCGCAHAPRRADAPVPIESRALTPPPEVASPEPPATLGRHIAADTLAAVAAMRRCAGRTLLPEQDSTLEAARGLLADVRAAVALGELSRAESLARQVRQLTRSLGCP